MNTQITEDYVSYEVAQLLKEKGFDETCYACYEYFESGVTLFKGWTFEYKGNPVHNTNDRIKCPTLQMAMKWLREVHEIYIEIPIYSIGKPVLYRWNAFKKGRLVTDEEKPKTSNCIIKGDDNNPTVYYYKYEEACEAALEYCLTNLI